MARKGRAMLSGTHLGYTDEEWHSFSKSKRWRLRNPEKMKAAVEAWATNNPERRRALTRSSYLQRAYGITQDDYASLLRKQEGRCAICATDKPTGKWHVFAVDHDHTTGAVRGLLCNECNRGMGLLRDSEELLMKAAAYLRDNKKTQEERQ